ncbi:MAG: hypothetical protein KME16_26985 [Scytolyngbya sp. HA4215-MV1]|nr:hypothetical protein [Scytolyngbya sp. HA4215-MV1]
MTRTTEEDLTNLISPDGSLSEPQDVPRTTVTSFQSETVGQGSPWQRLPLPLRVLIRPLLVASLGLHALFLFTPFPNLEKPAPKQTEAPVKITQLPSVKPKPKVPRPKVKKVAAKVNRPRPTVPVPKTPESKSANETKDTKNDAKDPFLDFPHHPRAQAGCYDKESCYEVKGVAIDAIADYFKQTLPTKKFTLTPLTSEAGKQVFQVTKGDKSLFLNLFQDGKNTVYVLAPNEIPSLKALKGAIEIPTAFYELLAGLPGSDSTDPAAESSLATPEDFDQPKLFYQDVGGSGDGFALNPEQLPTIDGSMKVAIGEEPEPFYQSYFESELQNIFEAATKVGDYGGGPLYQLKKGGMTLYLNLVPLKAGSSRGVGTIVVVWTQSPK